MTWYTTKALLDYSLRNRFYITATVRADRKGFPPALKGLKLKHMEQWYWLTADKSTMVSAFLEKKAKKHVIMAWTDSCNDSITVKGKTGGTREKPSMVCDYNNFMNGCDRTDQAIGYYGLHSRRSRKWWKRFFFWALEITINNAYILFKMTLDRPLTFYLIIEIEKSNAKNILIAWKLIPASGVHFWKINYGLKELMEIIIQSIIL